MPATRSWRTPWFASRRSDAEVGTELSFDKVMLLSDGQKIEVGTPYLEGKAVTGGSRPPRKGREGPDLQEEETKELPQDDRDTGSSSPRFGSRRSGAASPLRNVPSDEVDFEWLTKKVLVAQRTVATARASGSVSSATPASASAREASSCGSAERGSIPVSTSEEARTTLCSRRSMEWSSTRRFGKNRKRVSIHGAA